MKKVIIISALCLVAALLVCSGLIVFANKAQTPIKKDITASLIINGISDSLKSGDIISITAPSSTNKTQEFQYVKVTSVKNADIDDIYYEAREGVGYGQGITKPVKVSFALCVLQHKAFISIDLNKARIKLVCHSSDSKVQELLQKQDSVIRLTSSSTASQGYKADYTTSDASIKYNSNPTQSKQTSSLLT